MHLANEAIAEACRLPVRAALCALFAASCALVANGAPVSFRDAAKIKSWDAWNDHKTPEPPKEKPCVTWKKLNTLDPGLKEIGRLAVRGAKDIKSSKWSVGCETMDRDYADWNAYKHLLGPLGIVGKSGITSLCRECPEIFEANLPEDVKKC